MVVMIIGEVAAFVDEDGGRVANFGEEVEVGTGQRFLDTSHLLLASTSNPSVCLVFDTRGS